MQSKIINPISKISFWDVLVGLPAGVLIFMGTVLLSTLISLNTRLSVWAPFAILVIVTLFVGWLTGITRLRQGPATAFCAGCVAAAVLGYLWFAARPGDEFNPLVIGPLGMLTVLILCPAAGWLGAKLRKAL
jgi:hypothetical protein